jgi:SpoVK/Ycf46/Vps4 family AAA+-type ATPase
MDKAIDSSVENSIDSVRKNAAFQKLLKLINSMIGLEEIKQDIESTVELLYVSKIRERFGLKKTAFNFNTVFMGNPGTGKTSVARLYADFYKASGLLKSGHLVEVTRADLVSNVVGGTALKTRHVFMSSLDGVLFIDEAYSLVAEHSNDFGLESISMLIKLMDDNRERVIVIVAGYADGMKRFLQSNPGITSRFTRKFYFEDYSNDQLLRITKNFCDKDQYTLSEQVDSKLISLFEELRRKEDFGNGRDARRVYELLVKNHAHRLAQLRQITREELSTIDVDDVPEKAFE